MRSSKILLAVIVTILATSLYSYETKKKQHFRELIVPAVEEVYEELQTQYIEAEHYIDSRYHKKEIKKLKDIYKVTTNEELLMAIKPSPKSIAIAQAAIESAWATSRFFREANNIFGVWSSDKNLPRIAANKKRGSRTIWLKKYATISDSIRDYYKILATGAAYKKFRELKMKTDNPYRLVKRLNHYSELGEKYTKELSSIIKYNKFYLYD